MHWIKTWENHWFKWKIKISKRWAQTPRIPETSVLGHMLTVAILDIFFTLEVNACDKRLQNNFLQLYSMIYQKLNKRYYHPVKYCVDELSRNYCWVWNRKIEDDILPNVPEFYTKSSLIF